MNINILIHFSLMNTLQKCHQCKLTANHALFRFSIFRAKLVKP